MNGAGVAIGVLLSSAAAPGAAPPVTDLRPITLHPGVNHVPGFLVGGDAATIIEGWRGNGNAHGHHTWVVLGGASEGNPVGVVGVEGDGPSADTISDDPFDGERVLGTVRFATARLRGRPVALMIRADLNEGAGGVPADHATATVRWYRLDHEADAIGRPTDSFVPIGTATSTRRYCNADLALRDVAGVPLPASFGAANKVDGCFPGG